MSERVCIFRRIRVNHGTTRRPSFQYFQRWEDDGGEWAWWTRDAGEAFAFPDQGEARASLRRIRQHDRSGPLANMAARIVRVMGSR
jgi:hypothetical protein